MKNRDGDAQILEILHEGTMIMTRSLQEDLDLGEGDKDLQGIRSSCRSQTLECHHTSLHALQRYLFFPPK